MSLILLPVQPLYILAGEFGPFIFKVIINKYVFITGAPLVALVVKNLPASAGDMRDTGSIPGR